jgi:nitrite reductase/ring-hydroxylating ferredoxin subunit
MSQTVQISLPPYLPTGQILPIQVAGRSLALARVGNIWHVFENSCPHAGCSFSGSGGIWQGVLSCDCHGAEFDLKTGAVLQGPIMQPVTIFATHLNDTSLEIFLS